MIRKFKDIDLDKVSQIWINTNISAHSFIPADYWMSNFEAVKEMLPQAEIYVYEEAGEIEGFVGLNESHIEGIFVTESFQSQGIGRKLLNYVKGINNSLSLNVYEKNIRAVRFYERESFKIVSDGTDEATGEKDYLMVWNNKSAV